MSEKFGAVRGFLQDILAPQLQRLDEKVSALADRSKELAQEVDKNRSEILVLWKYVKDESTTVRERVSRVEGRFDGIKEEIVAKVLLSMNRSTGSEARERLPLPPTGEP